MANSKGVTGRKACTMIGAAFCLALFTYLCCSKVTYRGMNFLCIFWTRCQACLQQMPLFLFRLSKKVNINRRSRMNNQSVWEKNPEKKFRLGWESTLTFTLAGHSALSIELIKLAGERTVVTGLPWSEKSQGKTKIFQGKGKVRENLWYCQFCFLVYSS